MSDDVAPVRAGAIHDIGYRHYDGPRLGASYIRRSLFVETMRGAYGLGPVGPLEGHAVPAAGGDGAAGGDHGHRDRLLRRILAAGPVHRVVVILLQVAVTIFLGSQSPAVMSRDLRFRVAPLYFSRPLSRQQYVQAKYAGMAVALFVLMGLPITILLVGALLAELPLGDQLPDYLRAMAGAAIYSLVLAGIGLVVAAMTPRRGLGLPRWWACSWCCPGSSLP